MPCSDLVAPALEGASERSHLDRPGFVGHVADQLIDELTSERVVGHTIELAERLLDDPRGLDLSKAVAGAHESEHLVGVLLAESFGRHGEQAP